MIRMAAFLCTVSGLDGLVRLCARCHSVLRDKLTSSFKISDRRFSCDGCTKRST